MPLTRLPIQRSKNDFYGQRSLHGIGCSQDDAVGTRFSEWIFERDPLLLEMISGGLGNDTRRFGSVQPQTVVKIRNVA